MTDPLTELPDDDAPLAEWCKPISASMVNIRAQPAGGNAVPGANGAGKGNSNGTTLRALRKKLKARGLIK